MTTFLTSSPTGPLGQPCERPGLDPSNGFVEELAARWRPNARCLMVAAFPDAHARNDEMTGFYRAAVENAGLTVSCFDLWDDRRAPMTRQELHGYDAVFTAGGHVPTQHRWFESISLRELLAGYGGLVVGTSAGSMNAAVEVYGWPEEPGESCDPAHELFFPGLGLARTVLLPHHQLVKDNWLDGRRLMEDITCSHSHGRRFYAIPDGSYLLVEHGRETLYGESWLVADGTITKFSEYGQKTPL